jgi:ribosomal-protein-alanine acetyltransferase
MSAQAQYVRMGEADLAAVVALEERIQAFPWTPGNFRDALASGYDCWLQREPGGIAAFAVTMPVVDETHLLDIGVAPQRQRGGLGRALLAFLENEARQAGMQRMLLEVRPSNTQALAFYGQAGFVEIGRRRGYYPAPEGREDAIVMAKDL